MEADLRFPIGKFQRPTAPLTDSSARSSTSKRSPQTPARLNDAVKGLKPEQLDTRYRPDGWTVRQVTHHVPDSHMNAYIRFKLALTEDLPLIKPYNEAKFAELGDVRIGAHRAVARPARKSAQALGAAAAHAGSRGVGAPISPSGTREAAVARRYAGVIRLARETSCGAHYVVARTRRLVVEQRKTEK